MQALLPRYLGSQQADFTVIVGYRDGDPTGPCIEEAARQDDRIIPVKAAAADHDTMEEALRACLAALEQARGRRATDALIAPLPQLIIGKGAP